MVPGFEKYTCTHVYRGEICTCTHMCRITYTCITYTHMCRITYTCITCTHMCRITYTCITCITCTHMCRITYTCITYMYMYMYLVSYIFGGVKGDSLLNLRFPPPSGGPQATSKGFNIFKCHETRSSVTCIIDYSPL